MEEVLEMLQAKAKKLTGTDMEEADDEDLAVSQEHAGEDEEDTDDVSEEEDEEVGVDEGDTAEVDEEDDASENVEEDASENEAVPIGDRYQKGKLCKRDRKTSCYSPRGWIGKKSLKQCNDMCAKGDKGCKFFFWGNNHCSLCKKCGRTAFSKAYTIYKKFEIKFPVRDANCKERYSQKRLGQARGCKKRAKKVRAVAFSYSKKSKQCRTWKTCSATKKQRGWVLQKTR
jgi:hypothetical protein